ncbi:MAG: hypothetical protein J3Q66DRAFT_336696 [Benniella sp.]|nr:MAG: hypothetical protein J3Q66DRAFT_336696 [Benniella sp.]
MILESDQNPHPTSTPDPTPLDLTAEEPLPTLAVEDTLPSLTPVNLSPASTPNVTHMPALSSNSTPTYNILLLGPTQAGKSTFIESVKRYADPSYVINTERIGTGNESCTSEVRVEEVTTNLPIYRLYDLADGNREFDLSRIKDERAFKKFLARDDDLSLQAEVEPDSANVQFRIFDTPGLDDTHGNDIPNIAKVLSALSESNEIHLVLIMDSHHVPLIPSQKEAFKTYFNLFQRLRDLMTIVHTHVPNQHRFPGTNSKLDNKLKERSEFFNGIAGVEVPSKRIDCDLEEEDPAPLCLTRNAIREILEIAMLKTPVAMNRSHIHKLPTMAAVDDFVRRRFEAKLDAVIKARDSRSKQNEADQLLDKIEEAKREVQKWDQLLRQHDTNELHQLYEKRYGEEITFIGWFQDLFGRANEVHKMEFPHQEFTIHNVKVGRQWIDVLDESGGHGQQFWSVQFKRHAFRPGYYHVVLNITSSTKYYKEIAQWKPQLETWTKTLEDLKTEHIRLKVLAEMNIGDPSQDSEELREKKSKYEMILELVGSDTLPVDLFLELANAGVYQGTEVNRSADALEDHLAKKFEIN